MSGLEFIASSVGHTQVQSTARYAHLANDSVKAAAGKVSDFIGKANSMHQAAEGSTIKAQAVNAARDRAEALPN